MGGEFVAFGGPEEELREDEPEDEIKENNEDTINLDKINTLISC